jgi:hypothetical protein
MKCFLTMVFALGLMTLSSCMSLRAYDGERRDNDEVATVLGDFKVRAGAPVSLLLRKVDERVVDVRYSSVKLLPGKHRLLIDCKVQDGGTSRYALEEELSAGVRYRIVTDTDAGNRNCENVRLDARN